MQTSPNWIPSQQRQAQKLAERVKLAAPDNQATTPLPNSYLPSRVPYVHVAARERASFAVKVSADYTSSFVTRQWADNLLQLDATARNNTRVWAFIRIICFITLAIAWRSLSIQINCRWFKIVILLSMFREKRGRLSRLFIAIHILSWLINNKNWCIHAVRLSIGKLRNIHFYLDVIILRIHDN